MEKKNNLKETDFTKNSEYFSYFSNKQSLKKEEHELFGNIFVTKIGDSRQKIFKIEKVLSNKGDMAKEIVNAKLKMKLKDDNILRLLDYSTSIQNNWCSKFFIIQYYYEYPENDLFKEIKKRRQNYDLFDTNELTSILFEVSKAMIYLKAQSLSHNEIRPENIIIDSQNQSYKLIDSLNRNLNPIEKQKLNFQRSKKNLYISQEIYYNLVNKRDNLIYDLELSDSFSLGLIFLEAALLEDIQLIYGDRDQNEINFVLLEKLLKKLEMSYKDKPNSSILIEALTGLLNKDPKERLTFIQLCQGIEEYYNEEKEVEKEEEDNIEFNNNFIDPSYNNEYKKSYNKQVSNENLEGRKSNTYVGKVTVSRYKVGKNGEKVLIENPKITENENQMVRVSKTYVNEPITQINRTYTDEGKINFNHVTKEDIDKSNNMVNNMVPTDSRTFVGEPITKNEDHVQLRNSRSYKNEVHMGANTNGEPNIRLSRTYENEPVIRLSRTYENSNGNNNVKSNFHNKNPQLVKKESNVSQKRIVKVNRYKIGKNGEKILLDD